MRRRWVVLALLVSTLAACGARPLPTVIVTTTPTTDLAAVRATAQAEVYATLTAQAPTPAATAPAPSPTAAASATVTPTATLAPTQAATATATSTATLAPTAMATATATPTRTPTPTPTATPTRTPQPACAIAVDPELAAAWSQAKQGCPVGVAAVVWAAWEPFQHGDMLWRSDNEWAYLFNWQGGTNPNAGSWLTGGDAWKWDQISFPEGHGLTPPPGLYEPIRGFGFVWFNFLGGPSSQVGWATDIEKGFCARRQPFESGFILKLSTAPSCQDAHGNQFSTAPGFGPLFLGVYGDGSWKRY